MKTGTIEGAVTLQLTADQIAQASKGNSLWVMGGTPTDPVATPANYAFGALRCGVDNLNGDNVEWVTFPNNSIHVFCFAYYVMPPPPAGTIIVRKRLSIPAGAPDVPPQTFRFTGNLSFTPDPADSNNPQSNYFNIQRRRLRRGAVVAGQGDLPCVPRGRPGPFREAPPAVVLGHLRQAWSARPRTANRRVTKNPADPRRGVRRCSVAGDVVTCTSTNNLDVSARDSTSAKYSLTGGGRLRSISAGEPRQHGAGGDADDHDRPGGDRRGGPSRSPPQAGARVHHHRELPRRDGGHSQLASATCGGQAVQRPAGADDHPRRAATQVCTAPPTTFVPKGSITLRKVTLGATATTAFVISPDFGTPVTYTQSATTTHEGTPSAPPRRATTPRRCRSAPICSAR